MLSTQDIDNALRIAGELIDAGVPVFAAAPCPAAHGGTCPRQGHERGKEEYDLPPKWQLTVPSRVWLERWRPGWALGAVGGGTADFLDEDPRNGGEASVKELEASGQWPRIFGVQETPSGGFHHVISPLGEREANGFMPGLDYQGGREDGIGRAFVWIAPTVKRSKAQETLGEVRPYRWLQEPDLDYLRDFESDDSVEGVRLRLHASRERAPRANDERAVRMFTEEEARSFCNITLDRVMKAEIGKIEEYANDAACQLSHFVPQFWTEDQAFAVLSNALAETAYDPDGPSGWTADKFRAVLKGENERAPEDWRAERKPADAQEAAAAASPDAVDALIAEMKRPVDLIGTPPPKHLIRGILTLDSEAWIIGAPGSKKSFVALDMAAHVARGMPWQGLKVTQGRIVMIVAEGASGTGKRMEAWEKTYGPLSEEMFILPRPVQARDMAKWGVLVKACERIGPSLVIIDTQARVTVGLKENDATDMGIYIEAQRAIREVTGACVLTVHHTGRAGGDARGSSAIDGAQGTELKVDVEKEKLAGRLISDKQKDIEEAEDIPLRFGVVDLGVDEDGAPINSLVLLGVDAYADAAAASGVTAEEITDLREPGVWTLDYMDGDFSIQRRILETMRTVGKSVGLTKAEYKRVVTERWYPKPKRLAAKDFEGAWTAVLGQMVKDIDLGDVPLVVSGGGKFRLSEEAFD